MASSKWLKQIIQIKHKRVKNPTDWSDRGFELGTTVNKSSKRRVRILSSSSNPMTFPITLDIAVTFENFQNFTCFNIFFFTLNSSTEKNSLFNYSCLSYIILALSSGATNLPNKTLIFHDFQGRKIKFHDYPGLENEILTFHDFQGFPWPVHIPCSSQGGTWTRGLRITSPALLPLSRRRRLLLSLIY